MTTVNRQDVILSLVKELPPLSNSLVRLIDYLRTVIENDVYRDQATIKTIYDELRNLINNLKSVIATVNIDKSNLDKEDETYKIVSLYGQSIHNIILGIQTMLDWATDKNMPDEKLKESVNLLFKGGQGIVELVEKITQND